MEWRMKMPNLWKYCFIFICLSFFLYYCTPEFYDVVILDGTIVDGTGEAAFQADIGIKNGNIAVIRDIKSSQGKKIIPAKGRYVVPGFIDMHTHCDNLSSQERKEALNYLTQGVTTVVTGNCGDGTFEVAEFFNTLQSQGIGVNVVHLTGQGSIRYKVMQDADREPTAEELKNMKDLVERAMKEGATGLSTGLFYAPGSFSKTEEIISLLDPVKKHHGIYATHLRDESNYTIGLLGAVKEAIEIGEKAGVAVQISHIKTMGQAVWGLAPQVCKIIEEAQKRGVSVYADQYPYIASSTGLVAAVIPRWVQADGRLKERLLDKKQLPKIKKEIAANIERRGGAETLVISSFSKKPDWLAKSLKDISGILNKSEVDTAIELVLMDGPSIISFNMKDSDMEYFMQKPWVMTGSDGSSQIKGRALPHPRSYGTFPRKLCLYVLEKKLLTIEQAVRSATGLPAKMLGLSARGLLKVGNIADVVVFDPETIQDKATFTRPHQYSQGIDYVLISGHLVIDDGEFTGTLAGKPIRHE
jgi:N-acyl-D-amino-acid deacylase